MANTIKIKNSGTTTAVPSALEYGELGLNYADGKLFYKNSSNAITEFVGQKGDTGATGAGGALGYWGSFWSTQDQTAAAANTAYAITFNNVDPNSTGVSVVSGSRVTFANAGVYSLIFSIQWVNTSNDIIDGNVWFKKNGTNIDDSDSKWSVVSRHGGVDGHAIGTVNVVLSLAANDYIELTWQTTNTALSIEHVAAASPAPSIPSVIFTATQVMYTQLPSDTVLNDFQDVTVPSPSAGEYLAFNGSVWVNSGIVMADITDGQAISSNSSPVFAGLTVNGNVSVTGSLVDHVRTNQQTASYTLVLTDDGKMIEMNVGTANNLTVPADNTVNFPVGTSIDILQVGAGQTTINPASGVTINRATGLKLRTQWSAATVIKRAANTWVAVGDLSA